MKIAKQDLIHIPQFIKDNERELGALPSKSQLMNVVSALRIKETGIKKAKEQIMAFGNKRKDIVDSKSSDETKPKPKPMLKHEWKIKVKWEKKEYSFDDMMLHIIESGEKEPDSLAEYMDILVSAIIASRDYGLINLWKGVLKDEK